MKYPYLYRGIILDNNDPKSLGRCKVLVPSIHGGRNVRSNLLPWSRPLATTNVNKTAGSYCIPKVDDIVWVFFEGGDIDSPVYIGGTYGVNDITLDLDKVMLYKSGDDEIYYDRKSKVFDVKVGDSLLDISESGVTIKSGAITLNPSSSVVINGNLQLNGDLTISGSCNKECTCDGC